MIQCDASIYRLCIASLSIDGTLSVISVEDFTVIKNHVNLFSENSQAITVHETDSRLILAVQASGIVEIVNFANGAIILKISGFSSVINHIRSHGSIHSVYCLDSSVSIFTMRPDNVDFLYHTHDTEIAWTFVDAIVSPDLACIFVVTADHWTLYDSSVPLFEQSIGTQSDSFVQSDWISSAWFFFDARWPHRGLGSGHIGRRRDPPADQVQFSSILCFAHCVIGEHRTAAHHKTRIAAGAHPPRSEAAVRCRSNIDLRICAAVTVIVLQNTHSQHTCGLDQFFRSKYKGGTQYADNCQKPIGEHSGAFDGEDLFFSFSQDGSVKNWDMTRRGGVL
jgi:hypothetical protein